MKCIIYKILLLLSFNVLANDYVTYQTNDNATFKRLAIEQDLPYKETTLIIEQADTVWKQWNSFFGKGEKWVAATDANEIFLWNEWYGAELLVDFDDAVGTEYINHATSCSSGTRISEKNIDLEINDFVYRNVIRLDFHSICDGGGLASVWFAPKVGVIQWLETYPGYSLMAEYYTLISANIDQVDYPLETKLTFSSEFPKPFLSVSTKNLNVETQLINESDLDLTIYYSNGQEFEIELLTMDNISIQKWSDDVRFLLGEHEIILKRGEMRNFGGSLDLQKNDVSLSTGQYKVRMTLLGSLENNIDASQILYSAESIINLR
ncbi:MAG: BsuPI-related putative proteinase inhibitor [Pseudomonadota bacterium]